MSIIPVESARRRKPNHLRLKQNLYDRHGDDNGCRRYEHMARLDANGPRTVSIDWCIDNLAVDAWTWGWDVNLDNEGLPWHEEMVFSFVHAEDAMRFKLVFSEQLSG